MFTDHTKINNMYVTFYMKCSLHGLLERPISLDDGSSAGMKRLL